MSFFRSRHREAPAMTLEGVLGPNGRLDDARGVKLENPDAVCLASDGRLLCSSGANVVALARWGSPFEQWAKFGAPVTALSSGPGGLIAVGLAGGAVAVLDASGAPTKGWSPPSAQLVSAVDCMFLSADEVLVADCGYGPSDDVLANAAWDDQARGRLMVLTRSGEARVVAAGLHCPMGVSVDDKGVPIVALLEWASIIDVHGKVLQSGYPGYLGRLRKIAGGHALACLSRRDPLIEFLKTERAFVAEMKAKIAPRHWIAPRTNPEFSHDLPIELGATRLFGEVKPWAPSFSYGLLVQLDDKLMPVGSAQSRANGQRHAISDVAMWNGELIAVSKASGEILNLGRPA